MSKKIPHTVKNAIIRAVAKQVELYIPPELETELLNANDKWQQAKRALFDSEWQVRKLAEEAVKHLLREKIG